jgi:hypothetical protein
MMRRKTKENIQVAAAVVAIIACVFGLILWPSDGMVDYRQDVVAHGSGSSYTRFGEFGDNVQWSDSDIVLGRIAELSESSRHLNSSFKINGSGQYGSFSDIGAFHGVSLSGLSSGLITTEYMWNRKVVNDTVDEPVGFNVSGRSEIHANLTGGYREFLTGTGRRGEPLDLVRFSSDGPIKLTSKVVI